MDIRTLLIVPVLGGGYALGTYSSDGSRGRRRRRGRRVNWLVNLECAASAQVSSRLPDETALLQVRETLQQTRRALQEGDQEQADCALARLEQVFDDAEQALRQARQTTQQGQQQGGG